MSKDEAIGALAKAPLLFDLARACIRSGAELGGGRRA
jgi:hypothetical protein